MGQIRVLSPGLVNRIAAGECVERPASVVKELVENSLDAGAGRIDVTILDGGRGLIQVADDGVGMDVEDLRLSVTPHATSKIHTDEDLFNIHTMGFRGEALPSIGAVSRLRITSRQHDSEVAHNIRVEAGELIEPTPCAGPPGTMIEVRELFYCVPARRKFLRTNQTEMGHITEQLARIALAHPAVAFSLKHQNRPMHRLEATSDRRQRIADFYGPELAEGLLSIRRESGGMLVEGYVAPPAQCRRSGKWEYVFVNGRYVRDRFIGHALKSAYRSLIKHDERPVVFLFITVEPAQVDVNVHPTKVEVRWRDSNYVHAQVLAALREKFLSTNLDRTLRAPVPDEEAYRQRVRHAMVDFFTRPQPSGGGPPAGGKLERQSRGVGPAVSGTSLRSRESDRTVVDAQELPAEHGLDGAAPALRVPPSSEPVIDGVGERPRAIQVHHAYLVAETDDGLMIVDQHALHERILYEELRRRITDKPLESQRLLLPEPVRVPPDRIGVLETHARTLARLGIALEQTGPQTVSLHAYPLLLERLDPTAFVRDLLDLLSEQGEQPNTEALVHDVLDMMACKAAVKAGDPLTSGEIEALLDRRELAERVSHCPHGRPTTLRLSLRDLERQFKRR